MRVLLIHPPLSDDFMLQGNPEFPSMGLACISSAVKSDTDAVVRTLDAYTGWLLMQRFNARLFSEITLTMVEEFTPDVVGFSITSHTRHFCLLLAKLIKARWPAAQIVCGGAFSSLMYSQILSRYNGFVDYVVRGEGERAFPQLLQCIIEGQKNFKIPGVYYHNEDGVQGCSPKAIANLNQLPFPDYSYPASLHQEHKIPTIGVVTSRGCPYRCSFCGSSAFWGGLCRSLEPARVVNELSYYASTFGTRVIKFHDDTFTLYPNRAQEIFQRIQSTHLGLELYMHTRTELVDVSLLTEFRASGGKGVFFGVESGSRRIREAMGKGNLATESIIEICRSVKSFELTLGVFVLLGHPEETDLDIRATFDFLEQVQPNDVYVSTMKIQPGTRLAIMAQNLGIFDDTDWFTNRADYFTFFDQEPDRKAFLDGCVLLLDQRYRRSCLRSDFENNQEASILRQAGIDCEALKNLASSILYGERSIAC